MKGFILLTFCFILETSLFSQTSHIPSFDGGLENAGGLAGNGWTVVNSTTNQWIVGTGAIPFAGSNSAYISNNGSSYSYTNNASQTSHFYRDITIPASETFINLTFKLKSVGEPSFDRLLVYTAPTSVTPLVNDPASSSSALAGAALIYTDPANVGSYTTVNVYLSPSLAGTTFRLIFTWQNDLTGTPSIPVSVDNIALTSSTGGSLNGNYTINTSLPTSPSIPASGSNFNTFSEAVSYLNTYGISGKVKFQVPAGTVFNEPIINITATGNAVDSILFVKSGVGNNPVFIPNPGTTTTDAAIKITGGDFIFFNGIDILSDIAPATTQANIEYGYYLVNASATNGATNCTIKNCTVTLSNNFTSSIGVYIHASTVPSAAAGANSLNNLDNISINRAYVGIRDNSNSTIRNSGNTIQNCTLGSSLNTIGNSTLATSCFGIHALNPLNITIKGNRVNGVTVAAAVDGICLQNGLGTNTVSHNIVSGVRNTGAASTTAACGIRAILGEGGTANIYNNFVYDISHAYSTTTLSTIYVKGISIQPSGVVTNATVFNVDFNSVQIDGTNSPNVSNSCLEVIQAGPSVKIRNNILSNITPNQSGNPLHYCINVPSNSIAGVGSLSNRNDFYCPNASNGFIGNSATVNRATIANWQVATSQDANSLSVIPQFVSSTNLHVFSADLDNVGSMTGITWITDDIDFTLRSTTPDIGADEFSLVNFDLEMQVMLEPVNNAGCFTSSENVKVRIKNLAGQAHDFSTFPVFIQIDISGATTTQLLTQINDNALVGGPLGSLQTLIYDAGSVDMTAYGNYNFRCKLAFPQDQNHANDSLSAPVVITNDIPLTLPSSVDFNAYNGTNLTTLFPDWREATGVSPAVVNSSWVSSSGLGNPSNVTAKLNQNGSGTYNWILGKKIQVAFNTLLKFDVAVCSPSTFSTGTMGADDKLDVMISTDCGITYSVFQSYDISNGWNENLQSVVLPLPSFLGQDVILGLRAYNGTSVDGNYDLHLDNIMLFNSNDKDLLVSKILNPTPSNCFPNEVFPQIRILNAGYAPIDFTQTSLDLTFETEGAFQQTSSQNISTGTLAPGDSLDIPFTTPFSFTTPGQYFMKAYFSLSGGDVQTQNDTINEILLSQNPTVSLSTVSDTFCLNTEIVALSNAVANGTGLNNLPPINYSGLPVAIPDGSSAGVSIPLVVSAVGGYASQLVGIEITNLSHQYVGDLRLELFAPDGSSILLSDLNGGAGTSYTNTFFTMSASTSIINASAPFSGSYLPENSIQSLTGSANGTWFLKIADLAATDIGSITAWNLVFKEPNTFATFNWQTTLQNTTVSVDSASFIIDQQAVINFTATDVYGCTVTDQIEVFVPEDVLWNSAPLNICGVADVALSGATPAGGFYAGNGVLNDTLFSAIAGPGTQNLTYYYQSNQGCLDSAFVEANISQISLTQDQIIDASCFGLNNGSASVLVSQNLGSFTIEWDDVNQQTGQTAVNLLAGNYTVTATDSLCSVQLSVVISEPDDFSVSFVVTDEVAGNDGAIDLTVSGANSPYTYDWNTTAITEDVSGLSGGTYTVTILDANNCDTTIVIVVPSFVGVPENNLISSITVFPNPANDFIQINLDANVGALNFSIFDAAGKLVLSQRLLSSSSKIDLSNLSSGAYFIQMANDKGVFNEKIIINK